MLCAPEMFRWTVALPMMWPALLSVMVMSGEMSVGLLYGKVMQCFITSLTSLASYGRYLPLLLAILTESIWRRVMSGSVGSVQ